MKPILQTLLRFAAVMSASGFASAQDFAIEPLGPNLGSGVSTDGNFAVSGVMTPMSGPPLTGGDFAITGEVQGFLPVKPLVGEELIVNGSFENTAGSFLGDVSGVMSLPAGSTVIPGWTTDAAEIVWVDNANSFGAATPFGSHSLDLTGYHDSWPFGGVRQTIATVPGQKYRLALSLGSNADYPGSGGRKAVTICVGTAGRLQTFVPTNPSGNQWETLNFTFTADAASTEILIVGLVASGNCLGLDNVSVVADFSPAAQAPPELVVNGNFEELGCPIQFTPDGNRVMSLQPGVVAIPGWTTTTAELIWGMNGNAFGPNTPHGELFLDFTGYHDAPPYGGITQELATVPGETYRLSFALGADGEFSSYRGPMSVEVTVGAVTRSFTFTPDSDQDKWRSFETEFTATSTATPLSFVGTVSTGGAYLGLDNVSVMPGRLPVGVSVAAAAGVTGDSLQLSFDAQAGKAYLLEGREELTTGVWETVPGTVRVGTGGTLQIQVPGVFDRARRFFRVRALP